MPYYPILHFTKGLKSERKRKVASNLLSLRKRLKKEVPPKDLDDHLLLATWNIRDLGKKGQKQGPRNIEDLLYIAEIISTYDIVAVQEVNDLKDWETIMNILGRDWEFIATDVSEYADGGNGERMTFVYDTRKVRFKNIAGEIVISRTKLITDNIEIESSEKFSQGRQFARTPFLVSFQAGWFRFDLCTVHIFYGAESGDKLKRRIKEIETISNEISKRAEVSLENGKTTILLGDFNIVHPEHKTMQALRRQKFIIPKKVNKPSNIGQDKYYDQIAIRTEERGLISFIDRTIGNPNGGVLKLFKTIMSDRDFEEYIPRMKMTKEGKKLKSKLSFQKYFKKWRTYHLSDHHPMWVRIPINKSDQYLKEISKR